MSFSVAALVNSFASFFRPTKRLRRASRKAPVEILENRRLLAGDLAADTTGEVDYNDYCEPEIVEAAPVDWITPLMIVCAIAGAPVPSPIEIIPPANTCTFAPSD